MGICQSERRQESRGIDMDQMVNVQELQQVKYSDQLILTTEQLAEFYEVTPKQIKQNFANNKSKFREGIHYVLLEGDELKEFKSQVENFDLPISKYASSLYLWTKRGAGRHSKMLGTDKAWDMFDELEENYFNPKSANKPLTVPEQLQVIAQGSIDLGKRVSNLESNMRVNGTQEFQLRTTANKRAMSVLGGKKSAAYPKMSKSVFNQLWHDFKRYFELPRYGELPQLKFDDGIQYIDAWLPDTETRIEIANLNAQTNLNV